MQKNEDKNLYKEFQKIGEELSGFIASQKTDEALRVITIGALRLGVSDIHFDLSEQDAIIRFRVDGVLNTAFKLPNKDYKALLERFKYSASLKLNITDIPQDGKYSLVMEDKKIEIRVSTLPIKYGESMVCRILDSSKAIIDFENLGFFWHTKELIDDAINKKNGMILVTGPTGSGKTTTLYTFISKLNSEDKKIITLEDPIEYEIPGIVQSEVDDKKGYTFDKGLRAILRQDPDIIMVGEIRDKETLDIATNASLTGHLVLSTFHTKSAVETLNRIISMGMKPYIISSSIDIIIAQRLARRVCPHCKEEKKIEKYEKDLLKSVLKDTKFDYEDDKSLKLYEGKGCEYCNYTGFKGRIGVYEILVFDKNVRDLVRDGASTDEISEYARTSSNMITMRQDGVLKSIYGYTSLDEVMRVIG